MAYKHKNRPSGPELRDLLVDEALAVVERSGVDSLSATAVSLAVGASNAASYSHFRDGATELLAAVAARGFDQLTSALGDPSSTEPAEERVRQLFHRYVQFGLEHPHLYRAMFSPRLAPKLAAVNVATEKTVRGRRTYDELTVAKAIAYEAFVGPMQALGRASAGSSSRQGDAAKAVATLAHGLVLEFIDEGIDLGTTCHESRMTKRLAMASRMVDMLLHGVIATHTSEAE
jgi:AcrR family transcriptional regulator